MDYIRSLVSGKKKRFIDRKYNLDLSYITPRIIAMAYPASGLETVYRNNIDQVSSFLNERHKKNYLVVNLSGKKYDNKKFNKVLEYEWVDHHAPPLKLLFLICSEIHDFLKSDIDNVVAINCRAGKGRTGTVICCYLLFSGRFDNPADCFDYYSKKRFSAGEGVSQPSQKKYVEYFYQLLKEKIYFPLTRSIKAISLNKIPNKNSEGAIRPYFEIYMGNSDKISYSNKVGYLDQKKIYSNNNDFITITDSSFFLCVAGDLTIKIYNNEMLSSKKMGRISFNTAFLEENQTNLVFPLTEIDPDNLVKNKKIPRDFEIHIIFGKICDCTNRQEPKNICTHCSEYLAKEINDWIEIHEIIKKYQPISENDESSLKNAQLLLFGQFDGDDVSCVLGSELLQNEGENSKITYDIYNA